MTGKRAVACLAEVVNGPSGRQGVPPYRHRSPMPPWRERAERQSGFAPREIDSGGGPDGRAAHSGSTPNATKGNPGVDSPSSAPRPLTRPGRHRSGAPRAARQQHDAADDRKAAENRRNRHRLLLVGTGLDGAKVDDFLLVGEGEAAERQAYDAENDEQDADDCRRLHTTRLP